MLEQIKDILILHYGKKNSITASEIADMIGIVEDDTHAQTRALILECAEKYELPVAANNKGYYIISIIFNRKKMLITPCMSIQNRKNNMIPFLQQFSDFLIIPPR